MTFPISLALLSVVTRSAVILQDISCGDSVFGTWDGTEQGALTYALELTQGRTVTWDARNSGPNINPTVGTLVQYTYAGTPHGTADNDDVAVYPDEQEGVELLMELDLPAGSYNLTFEGTEGHDAYSYFTSLACTELTPTPEPTMDTPNPTLPTPEPTPNPTLETPAPTPIPDEIIPTPQPTTRAPTSKPTNKPTKKPTNKPTVKIVNSGSGSDSESEDGFTWGDDEQNASSNGSGNGTVTIVVSVLAVLLVVGAVAFYLRRRRGKEVEVYFEETEEQAANLDDDTARINTMNGDHTDDDGETEIVVEVEVN